MFQAVRNLLAHWRFLSGNSGATSCATDREQKQATSAFANHQPTISPSKPKRSIPSNVQSKTRNMTPNDTKAPSNAEQSLSLLAILNLASRGYPDEQLKLYYDEASGNFNKGGSGDTLAEFVVREIRETFSADLPKSEQLGEVCRALRQAITDIESTIEAVEKAQ